MCILYSLLPGGADVNTNNSRFTGNFPSCFQLFLSLVPLVKVRDIQQSGAVP